jgi:hypothetical protein
MLELDFRRDRDLCCISQFTVLEVSSHDQRTTGQLLFELSGGNFVVDAAILIERRRVPVTSEGNT